MLNPLIFLSKFIFHEIFIATYNLLEYIFQNIWNVIVAIGLKKLATTILTNVINILEDILSLIFDVIKFKIETLIDIMDMIWNFLRKMGLIHLVTQILEDVSSVISDVLNFLWKHTIIPPIKYYSEFVVIPSFEVSTSL